MKIRKSKTIRQLTSSNGRATHGDTISLLTGQDSFVAVAEHVQVVTVSAQSPFAAVAELALVAAVAD